eukprot:82045-Rhodomonas_salina.9
MWSGSSRTDCHSVNNITLEWHTIRNERAGCIWRPDTTQRKANASGASSHARFGVEIQVIAGREAMEGLRSKRVHIRR